MKNLRLKTVAVIAMASLVSQSFAIVDSTTDNQLPSMREEWQDTEMVNTCPQRSCSTCPRKACPRARCSTCPKFNGCRTCGRGMEVEEVGDIDLDIDVDYKNYRDEESDIEEMEAGGDYNTGWVS